jgi:hypothetical protein
VNSQTVLFLLSVLFISSISPLCSFFFQRRWQCKCQPASISSLDSETRLVTRSSEERELGECASLAVEGGVGHVPETQNDRGGEGSAKEERCKADAVLEQQPYIAVSWGGREGQYLRLEKTIQLRELCLSKTLPCVSPSFPFPPPPHFYSHSSPHRSLPASSRVSHTSLEIIC